MLSQNDLLLEARHWQSKPSSLTPSKPMSFCRKIPCNPDIAVKAQLVAGRRTFPSRACLCHLRKLRTFCQAGVITGFFYCGAMFIASIQSNSELNPILLIYIYIILIIS